MSRKGNSQDNGMMESFFGILKSEMFYGYEKTFKSLNQLEQAIIDYIDYLQLPYSNAKLEATNNLIKLIKRNAFGFRNFENFKKRIFIALNIKKERTKFVLSRA